MAHSQREMLYWTIAVPIEHRIPFANSFRRVRQEIDNHLFESVLKFYVYPVQNPCSLLSLLVA